MLTFGREAIAILIVSGLALATSSRVPLPSRVQRWLVAAVQPFFLWISALTQGSPVYYLWWHRRSFPDLNDYMAAWIYLAVGFVCGIQSLRYPETTLRVCGAVFSFVFGAFLAAEVVMKLYGFPHVFFGGWDVDWTPVIVALSAFAVAWIGFVWSRVSKWNERMKSTNTR